MKLLIAEDDLTSRTMLTAVTRKWGFEPVVVGDGEAAWQVMQGDESPRLLLLNWEMPRLSGAALCQRIRQQETTNPAFIILLTGRSETTDIVEALMVGANDYITKPFENAEVQARLQVGRRMLDLQDELIRSSDILTSERKLIENTMHAIQASRRFDPANLRQLQAPVERVSGDVLLSAIRPDGTQHLMLGDFTGHGLIAAIGGPIVYDTFYSMTAKDLPMIQIADEINRHLCEKLPTGLFFAAACIQLDADRRRLLVWNLGMEDVLIFRHQSIWHRVTSVSLPLGISEQLIDSTSAIEVEAGDRVYAYSDGITETINDQGEAFGIHRLEKIISELLISQGEIELLLESARQFRGSGDQLDDITLVELTC